MGYLIGMDEAGYGPNLGPLVIVGTLWKVPGQPQEVDLYQGLKQCVAAKLLKRPGKRVILADSKLVYQPGRGIGLLEEGVWVSLAQLNVAPTSWKSLWSQLCPEAAGRLAEIPWYEQFDRPLPLAEFTSDFEARAEHLRDGMAAAEVRLQAVRAVAIFPQEFNLLCEQYGSKGELLSRATVRILGDLLNLASEEESVFALLDKHGGRNRYGQILQEHFLDDFIEVRGESREESRYMWGPPERRVEARFGTRSDQLLPAAVASMIAKYLREAAMEAFNSFWREQVPEIRPTAGYPVDAVRFKQEIADVCSQLEIADGVLWRNK